MLDIDSADQLAAIFDQFSVPMFAAERPRAQNEFKILCVNQAYADVTGFQPGELRNAALHDLLPSCEADTVTGRYAECADTRHNMRYMHTLTLPKGVQQWDTSIQHVPLHCGGDRVIGTGLKVACDLSTEGTRTTFDNIRFFSSLADMQLQNLVSMFEAARDQGLFSTDSVSRITRLCGVCRSVQRSVEDIRETVRRAHPDGLPTQSTTRDTVENFGNSTWRALCETVQETR